MTEQTPNADPVVAPVLDPGPTSRVFFSQRLRLHYVDWGNPDAPPLILLHGGRDHCRNWDWVAADLRRDYHVICPDLRGHGDSAWSASGHYTMANYIYDLAQLIHQQKLAPVTIIAHSLGGNIALRYTGLYPETVSRIVAIEGLGPGPKSAAAQNGKSLPERMRYWIDQQRDLAARQPRRYPTLDAAYARMQDANKHLSAAQARHLTQHGVNQNEDGTYSWKFDHYVRVWPPYDMTREQIGELWGAITCPTLLVWGRESWATNPAEDGRQAYFRNASVLAVDGAGHWVHHDRLALFLREVRAFLAGA
jgi:pimeloyl-ACP methyl ester carboxylesterase